MGIRFRPRGRGGRYRNHICLLFAGKAFHRRGIAAASVAEALADCMDAGNEAVTVTASRYAVEVYRALNFTETGPEKAVNGIVFTPMQRPL